MINPSNMSLTFEENLCKCVENLKIGNFRAATNDLYPISKQTPRLGNARWVMRGFWDAEKTVNHKLHNVESVKSF